MPADMNTLAALRAFMGSPNAFWKSSQQARAVQFVRNHDDPLLVVLPTGGGKSLVYALPASAWDSERVTVVIIPFVALLHDANHHLARSGISTCVWQTLDQDTVTHSSIVLISADVAMTSHKFKIWLKVLRCKGLLARVTLDEAHIIITSITYRPILLLLGNLATLGVPLLFLTATMPPRAVQTFQQLMQIPFLSIIRAPTHRHDINYVIQRAPADKRASHPFFQPGQEYITSFIEEIRPLLNQLMADPTKRGIIFCPTRQSANQLAQLLKMGSAHTGATALADRVDLLENFRDGTLTQLLVGTTALSCGVSVLGVIWTAHLSPPRSVLDAAQDTGRSGRAGETTTSFMYFDHPPPPHDSTQGMDLVGVDEMHALFKHSRCARMVLSSVLDDQLATCSSNVSVTSRFTWHSIVYIAP